MLNRFREASESNLVEARITLAPDDKTAHEMVVKVMDACSHAGIESVYVHIRELDVELTMRLLIYR